MVLGVWLLANGLALGVWFGFGRMAFGHMVMGVGFWVYDFGCIVWTDDFGGTALKTRAGQAQNYTLAARYPGGTKSKESIRHTD